MIEFGVSLTNRPPKSTMAAQLEVVIPEMPYRLIHGKRALRSPVNFTRRDVGEFLHLAADIPVRTEVELFPLAEANRVLQSLKRSEIRDAAVLQIPWDE